MSEYPRISSDPNFQFFAWLEDEKAVFPTESAKRILLDHFPEWAALFLAKNRHYGETANHLGIKGQFADINRKFWPLKAFLWDDKEPTPGSETPEVIILDLIGHLFLTLDLLDQKERASKAWCETCQGVHLKGIVCT